jgi:hypothetical protein
MIKEKTIFCIEKKFDDIPRTIPKLSAIKQKIIINANDIFLFKYLYLFDCFNENLQVGIEKISIDKDNPPIYEEETSPILYNSPMGELINLPYLLNIYTNYLSFTLRIYNPTMQTKLEPLSRFKAIIEAFEGIEVRGDIIKGTETEGGGGGAE